MKKFYSNLLLLITLSAVMHIKAFGCPVPGTYTIGPTGNYISITSAIADLNTCASLTGPYIFEFEPAYTSSVETFPVTIPAFTGSSNFNTITFRPQLAAANISITSANTTGTLLLNGATYIRFDGRPGGSGSPGNLTIENTNVGASYAVQLINDAANNTISYCNIKSANDNSSSGTVVFSTAGAGSGNDNNTISHCDIFDASTGTPVNAVYQSGSASPNDNSSNSISNNNIYNFFSAAADMNGILLANNASAWDISGNSFYQTATRNLTGAANNLSAIRSLATTVSNLTITGNYIGGTATAAGGTALTLTGSGLFNGIMLTVSTSSVTDIQSNTIKNISLTTSIDGRSSLINLVGGKFNVGTVGTPNVLGSQSATGSITVSMSSSTASPNNPRFEGITAGTGTCDIVNIIGNTIGGISASGTSTTAFIFGIYFTGTTGTFTVDKNIIGSTTTANNFVSSLNAYLIGIYGVASAPTTITQVISNNKIVNLTTTSASASNFRFYGILTQGTSVYHTVSNEIYDLTSASTSTSNSIIGIYLFANHPTTGGQKVSGNKIYNLSNTSSASFSTGLVGIYYNGPTAGTNIVENNFIHSFSLATTSAGGYMHGIFAVTGNTIYRNNMVRLGIKADGTSLSTGYIIYGMNESSVGYNNYYHNSVYIGGTCSPSVSKTYAFYSLSNQPTSRDSYNNIFFNARTNSSSAGGGRHYGCYYKNVAGLSADHNDIISTGTDKVFASFNGTDYSTLAAWRTATGRETNSISSDPKYLLPGGTASSVDLHINGAAYTLAEGGGTLIASVTEDYDAQTRASFTPTDIGADAITNASAAKIDVGATALSSPAPGSCFSNAVIVKITIKNYGSSTIDFAVTPVTVSVAVTGAVTQNLTGTISSTTLAANSSTDVTMSATLDMTTLGTYTFNATIASVANTGVDADITNNDLLPAASRTATGSGVTWLGVTTDWNNASNWCGGIPDASTNIAIPNLGVGGNYPLISPGASGAVHNISIATNASVTVSNNAALTISGAITNNGGIVDNGEIILDGTASTNFPGNGTINAINDLTINKTAGGAVTFNKAFEISGVFTPVAGDIIVNNTVTLRSTDDSTARVGQSGATYTYGDSGNFEVQRYIPAKRAWRLLTSPLSATGNIYDNWQNAGVNTGGKGMLVTGPGATPGTNGLDISVQNNYSMKMWDISAQSLYGVGNTLSQELSGSTNPSGATNTGYFVFVRGDRTPSNTTVPNVNTTTLSSRGYLQTGTQIFSAAASSGDPSVHRYTLVGNPYASPIDFNLLTKTNLLDKFYVWDPIALDVGTFVTITKSGGSYIATPDRGAGGPNQYIQSSQAFYVETDVNTMVTPLLTIQESHKVSNNILTIFRPYSKDKKPEGMRINLYRLNTADNTAMLADGVYALYDNTYRNEITTDDAAKFTNINETFGLVKNGSPLAVQTKPVIGVTDTLYLRLTRMAKKDYRLEFKPEQLDHNNLAAFLEDKFLNTSTPLNVNSNTLVDFSLTTDPLSAAADRFKVVFRPSAIYTAIKAFTEKNDIAVQWELPAEINISKYIVERSEDGNTFTAIGEKISAGNSDTKVVYKQLDQNPAPGEYYYRIKSISKTGVTGYSDVVKVVLMRAGTGMYVFPNPVTGASIGLQMNDMAAGKYSIRLLNTIGQQLLNSTITHPGGTASKKITATATLTPGNYQLEVTGPDKQSNYLKVLVQ